MLEVRTGADRRCPVYIGGDAAAALASIWNPRWRQAVIICDSNTGPLFSGPIARALENRTARVLELEFPAGEASKTRATKECLEDAMLDAGIDRTACVVAVGGGVVTDLAGFVAATYMRGVDYINVATSLLAQVDSSIGGKTGVDVPRGKNLVGAFHQPSASLINTAALASLPAREFTNGMAELVKHAVIADTGLFEKLEKFAAAGGKNLPEDALEDSIRIKAEVVEADEKEAGMRQVLNFGHTFGHAIEKAEGYALPHGFCVSIGMALEAALAHRLTGFPAAETERLKKLLSALGLPVVPPRPFETIAAHIASDKKSREGKTRFALPKRIGEMEAAGGAWSLAVETVLIRAVYERESRQGAA